MNFNEWAKANPTKSLNDYYQAQALQAELQRSQETIIYSDSKTSNSGLWTVLTVILSLFFGGFGIYAYQKYNEVNTHGQNAQLFYTANDVAKKVKYEKDRVEMRDNWQSLIQVYKSGGKQLGVTGGFRDVGIVVRNNSDYTIDEVTAFVEIEGVWSTTRMCYTEIITFDNISSGSESTQYFSHESCGQILHVKVVGFKCSSLDVRVRP